MWIVYILYSEIFGKTYVGYTNDLDRRMFEHNVSELKGYTLKFRPWQVIHKESYGDKSAAIKREKYFKTGRGRKEIKEIVQHYLDGAVSAAAEKD